MPVQQITLTQTQKQKIKDAIRGGHTRDIHNAWKVTYGGRPAIVIQVQPNTSFAFGDTVLLLLADFCTSGEQGSTPIDEVQGHILNSVPYNGSGNAYVYDFDARSILETEEDNDRKTRKLVRTRHNIKDGFKQVMK